MQNWKRLGTFLLVNVVVSALTTWLVVSLLLRNYPQADLPQPGEVVEAAAENGGDGDGEESGDGGSVPLVLDQLAIDSVIGAGDLATERLQIRHVGDQEISLLNWQIQDENGNTFTFPALTMFSGGAVTIFTREGVNSVVELYWGKAQPVWTSGELAMLIDPNGNVQATYTVP